MIDLFLLFILYSILGWIYESTYCSLKSRRLINRGFLNGPYIPIYGVGALSVIFLFYEKAIALPFVFLFSMLLASFLEYATSYLLEKIFKARWWDYSNERYNINGRVYLLGVVAFGVMALIAIRLIHPAVDRFLQQIDLPIRNLVSIILMIGFFSDILVTVFRLLELNKKINEANDAFNRFRAHAGKKFTGLTTGLYEKFEESEYYPEKLKSFMNERHYQIKRILKAFPTFRFLRPSEFWDKLKKITFNKSDKSDKFDKKR
jgi:uncharacterized membrane protein